MTARSLRACLILVALALLASSGWTSAAGPTIGARISPVPLVVERQPWVAVTNLSELRLAVRLEIVGDPGYALAATSFNLDPDERRATNLTAIGPGEATIRAHLSARDTAAGTEAVELVLETRARHETITEVLGRTVPPLAWVGVVALVAVLGLLLLAAIVFWRRRRRDA